MDAVRRACNSTFWDWSDGSTLFYWRWPKTFQNEARDGTPAFVTGKLPRYKATQKWPRDPTAKQKMVLKLLKVVNRAYISLGPVASLTGCFPVPKGKDDIRMVYDATKCGLNEGLWAPNFFLPTVDTTLRQVIGQSWFGDIDLGEMFLNFPLDSKLRPYAGVDFTGMKEELVKLGILPPDTSEKNGRIFLRWVRCLMGLRSSPYNADKAMGWAEDVIRGHHLDHMNEFRWDDIILNLPGMSDYDPALPKAYKWDAIHGRMASNFEAYVDDIRTTGSTEDLCVRATCRVASMCNHLGIQDAARKRRFPSMNPGVWCGAKTSTDGNGVFTSTTQEKWDKGKSLVNTWMTELKQNDGRLERKPLEQGRGFMVHLSCTYPMIVPFLKGVHHTLEEWRGGRDENGWKYGTLDWKRFVDELKWTAKVSWEEYKTMTVKGNDETAPKLVRGVKRLERDLESLKSLFENIKPPLRLVRGSKLGLAIYGFGDASGAGFGSSFEVNDTIVYRFGVWGKDNNGQSSNYRELRNVVESLEEFSKNNALSGVEIYFFTDNSTAEAAFYKGSSTLEKLHELVTRLWKLEINKGCRITLCHVSGERMKAQGADGLSRGSLLEGVMSGKPMSAFVPLHLNAVSQRPQLVNWIKNWAVPDGDAEALEVLDPKGWFTRGHDLEGWGEDEEGFAIPTYRCGFYLWSPSPAAAEIACEELRKARGKRTQSTHVLVCPRLLSPLWRKHLHRSADLVFEIPAGTDIWPANMYEPLVVTIYYPFIKHRPWQLQGSPALTALGNQLQGMWKRGERGQGDLLRKFRLSARSLDTMSPSMVSKLLQGGSSPGVSYKGGHKRGWDDLEEEEGQGRFLKARPGDSLMAPFQCDHCWFINLKKREPIEGDREDRRLLGYIRRVNLDMFWSREAATVATNMRQFNKILKFSKELELPQYNFAMGPWNVGDRMGFQLAILLLRASQEKGRNSEKYVQFDSIRKMRSAVSSAHENSAGGSLDWATFRGEKGRPYRLSCSETELQFFTKFMRGLELRMGRDVRSNVGLDVKILLLILRYYNEELADLEIEWKRKREVIMVGGYLVACFMASLRGNEGLYLEGSDLVNMIAEGRGTEDVDRGLGHVCLPLLGRFKTETGEDKHVAVIASTSASGIQARLWMERMVAILKMEGKELVCGPAVCKENGKMYRSYELDAEFHSALKKVQSARPDLIPEGIDVHGAYGTFRSCRRGSLTRATEAGIKGPDLDIINRWRKWEFSKGSRPHMSMKEHYLEIRLVLNRALTYSKAL